MCGIGLTQTFERLKGSVMADEHIKRQIHDVLKSVYFSAPDDMVDVSDGPDDSIHLVLVSRKFDRQRTREKHEIVSNLLMQNLPEETWTRVSLAICKSPDEIKAGV
jgi:uncharacterized membrane protein